MWLMGFPWRTDNNAFVLSFEGVDEFLFFKGGNHNSLTSGIYSYKLSWIKRELPGTMRLQPLLPKVSSWVLLNRFSVRLNYKMTIFPESDPTITKSLLVFVKNWVLHENENTPVSLSHKITRQHLLTPFFPYLIFQLLFVYCIQL